MNFTDDIDYMECIPQSACSFYHGYYTMSADMGMLILKLGLLFFSLDIIHTVFKSFFDGYLVPKCKKFFRSGGDHHKSLQ